MSNYISYKYSIKSFFVLFLMAGTGMMGGGCTNVFEEKPAAKIEAGNYRVAFYNVENLFDTLDHPDHEDDDFVPEGSKQWTSRRYNDKINKLVHVIDEMGTPMIVGLAEVENKTVLNDLIKHPDLVDYGYDYIHYNSPDFRGIDVALIFQPVFNPFLAKSHEVEFQDSYYTSRNLLLAGGTLEIKNAGIMDSLYFLVNHWPSRAAGRKETEPKRVHVATQARKLVDSLNREWPNSSLIVMGDFNDEPHNTSIKEVLGAFQNEEDLNGGELFNPMGEIAREGRGSYRYEDDWNMLDQIMVSKAILEGEGPIKYIDHSASVFDPDWLKQQEGAYKGYPDRTYAGDEYLGGYSDHLPVYIEISVSGNSDNI